MTFSLQPPTTSPLPHQAWRQWGSTALGSAVLDAECQVLAQLIPSQYYPVGVQISAACPELLPSLNVGLPVNVGLLDEADATLPPPADLISTPESLPFAEHSADLMLLPHTLELCDEPLRTLREAAQVLAPEGVLAISGFNPLSFWGLRALFSRRRGHAPWVGRYFRVKTLQDWLALLGLELVAGGMMDYRPPLQNPAWRQRLRWLDKVGDRWWPGLGGVYVLVLKKQVYGKTPRPNAPVTLRRWLGTLAPAPVGKSSAKTRSRQDG